MKFFIKILFTVLIVFFAGPYLPFWSIALFIMLLNTFIETKILISILTGLLGWGLCWFFVAASLSGGDSMLIHEKVSEIFNSIPMDLNILTGILGAIFGGISAFTGASLRSIFAKGKSKYNPYSS